MTGLLGAFARGYLICRSLRTQPDPWLDRLLPPSFADFLNSTYWRERIAA